MKPRENMVQDDDEIRVTSAGSVSAYISRAAKLFNEMDKSSVKITATGNALTKAVASAEVIKRRFKGLHQITALSSLEVVDEYEPIEEGLDPVSETRNLPTMVITLSKEALDTKDPGYQEPLDESLVEEVDPEDMMKARGRGKGRGRGAGGRGKGEGKSNGKGKGKGKGKYDEEPKGKGKGKGKAKGKGKYDDEPKGKGKGKSSWDEPSKGKGKSSWDEPPRSKGKGKSKGWDDYGSSSYGGYGGGSYGGKSKSKGWEDRGYGGGYGSSYDRGYEGGGYSSGYGKGYGGYSEKGSWSKGSGKGSGKSKGGWGYSGSW